MSQEPQLSITGLNSAANDFTGADRGSLNQADNCVINYKNIIGPRNGFELSFDLPSSSDRAVMFADYQDNVVVRYSDDKIGRWNGSSFSTYSGAFSNPDSTTDSRFLNASKNLYVTTSVGVYVLDVISGTWILAGVPKALDVQLALVAGSIIADNTQTAYRVLFFIKDANSNLKYGSPSQFTALANSAGGTRSIQITSTLPSSITTSYFYQIYRSSQTATSSIIPTDQMKLVYEAQVTGTDISNKYIQVTDNQPDSLRGISLYTGSDQEGILQANDIPPYCKDLCSFKDMTLFVNCKSKQRLKVTIIGTGGANGLQSGDTLSIAGVTYTAAGTETTSTGTFKVFTAGSAAQNIADTADSLIRVINRYSSNTYVYAYLLSGPTDLPGQLLLEEQGTGASTFAMTASAHGSAYNPVLPTSGTTVSSAQDVFKNGVYISKIGQPEAVPLTNLKFAGAADQEIKRVVPLRDYVLILKDDGVYRATGSTPDSLLISPFDLTVKIQGANTAVALENEVWFLSSQGVVSVSDSGVKIRSYDIEDVLLTRLGQMLSTVQNTAFAISYESARRYILALPASSGDDFCSEEYVYNYLTEAWTRWTRVTATGYINRTSDKLYLAYGSSEAVSSERKTNTSTDFVDEAFAVTIVSFSTTTVTLTTVTGITVGDVLSQSGSTSVITAVDSDLLTITVQNTITWTPGAATVLLGIDCTVYWKPFVGGSLSKGTNLNQKGGNPTYIRQYSEGLILFKRSGFNLVTMKFYSDISRSVEDVTIDGSSSGSWGLDFWGLFPWGGTTKPGTYRFYVPQDKQYASQLNVGFNIRAGLSQWSCQGAAITSFDISEEIA